MLIRKTSIIIVLFIAAVWPVFSSGKSESSDKTSVVATTNIIYDVLANVAGDHADITGLIKVGQDPHGFEPAPRDIVAVETADIIFVNGFDLEENLLDTVRSTAKGRIVEVSEGIDIITMEDGHDDHDDHDEDAHHDEDEHGGAEHHHEGIDPHTWMSPLNVIIWTENIAEALSGADPANAAYYRENAEGYIGKLKELDRRIRTVTAGIPADKRRIIAGHRVFGYFARDYGYEMIGAVIPGFSTNSESSSRELADLASLIKSEDVSAVFIGESSPDSVKKLVQALSGETGREVRILPVLTGSVAPDGQPGDSYIGMLEYNIQQLEAGLNP